MIIEAMKQALEALEEVTDVFLDTEGRYGDYELRAIDQANKAAHALRKAIEEGGKLLKTTPEVNNSNYFKQEIVRNADMAYTIALQRAIEWHCESKAVPPDIAELCTYHSEMLNQNLPQLEQKAVLK